MVICSVLAILPREVFVKNQCILYYKLRIIMHDFLCVSGAAEQGQLGRVAECFTVRGGRRGVGKFSAFLY